MKSENLRNRILAFDLAWIPVALAAEQALCPAWHCGQVPLAPFNFIVYLVCTLFAWVLLSENLHLDGFCAGWRLSSVVSHLLLAVALLMVILLAVDNVSGRYVGRLTLSVFSLFLLAGFLCIRGIALRLVLRQYRNGHVNRVVILGSDRLATELAMKFNHHPEFLCKVIGFLCPKSEFAAPCRDAEKLPLSVSTMEVADLLRQHQVNELVLAHTPASMRFCAWLHSAASGPYGSVWFRNPTNSTFRVPNCWTWEGCPCCSSGICRYLRQPELANAFSISRLVLSWP